MLTSFKVLFACIIGMIAGYFTVYLFTSLIVLQFNVTHWTANTVVAYQVFGTIIVIVFAVMFVAMWLDDDID